MGTGLGLRIVKSFTDLMHGSVSVESKEGKGSCFTVLLPCRISGKKEPPKEQHDDKSQEKVLRNKTILLAEDNELNAEIAMTILQDAHARVEVASDGAIALSMFKEAPAGYYDVILMDIQMPHMNGYQASEAIRKLLDDRARTPIIAMTANAFEENHKAALAAGMDAYVAKPIEIDTLFSTITQVLENKITIKKS